MKKLKLDNEYSGRVHMRIHLKIDGQVKFYTITTNVILCQYQEQFWMDG